MIDTLTRPSIDAHERVYGDPALPGRIWDRLETNADGCWLWTGGQNGKGYGQLLLAGRRWYVHRLVYDVLIASIPPELTIDHLCRVRHCANPSHLEAVPNRVNLLRGDTIVAHCAAKIACPQGHPYDADNTYRDRGQRSCRACVTARQRRRYHAARASLTGGAGATS